MQADLLSAEFFYGDPDAPVPNRPIGVGVLALIERDGAQLIEGFGTLRCSTESTALRFFGREELSRLDVIETARPIIAMYLSSSPPVVVE